MLPTSGLTNFVPSPLQLMSNNYLGFPVLNGLPPMGPGTTNFPGIYTNNPYNVNASPASGSNTQVTSITKNYAPQDPEAKRRYAEILKQQMLEKDVRNELQKRENEAWEEEQERKISRYHGVRCCLCYSKLILCFIGTRILLISR